MPNAEQRLAHQLRLTELLAEIQRAILRRGELQDVLEAIVRGAQELLGDEVVGLRLVDREEPTMMDVAAAVGLDDAAVARTRRATLGEGVGGRAIVENRLVVVEDEAFSSGDIAFSADWLRAAAAAPVHENGRAIGSLVVASPDPARRYCQAERDTLVLFAGHASLALTDARNYSDALREARTDGLTCLANRRAFLCALGEAAESAQDGVGVLILDLDDFKSINDVYGHGVGDALLRAVAEHLTTALAPADLAARLGGDEFAVLVGGDPGRALETAQRILTAFAAPVHAGGHLHAVGASIGITVGAAGPEELLRQADLALYEAKLQGKARAACYEPGLRRAADARRSLEAELREALTCDELFLHYQPIVDLATGQVRGAEALVRWRHPRRGVLAPAEFIPLAEQTGLILPLGRWVLEHAARQASAWRRRWPGLAVGVNVSAVQVRDPLFVAHLEATLREHSLPPECLVLELTESVLMSDVEQTIARLSEVSDLGAKIAVDDFGTGFSSLQYLSRLPLDVLKLPRPFVAELGSDGSGRAIVCAVLELGRTLDLRVVAEGVETPAQRSELRALGCEMAQGFHFSRPVDGPAFEALLAYAGLASVA